MHIRIVLFLSIIGLAHISTSYPLQDGENPTLLERKKRSEMENEFGEDGKDTIQQAGVMECIYDFLFGEEDPVTGRTEGVFTKAKNWLKSMACRITGNCEETDQPIMPPVLVLPYNPDTKPALGIPSRSPDDDVDLFK